MNILRTRQSGGAGNALLFDLRVTEPFCPSVVDTVETAASITLPAGIYQAFMNVGMANNDEGATFFVVPADSPLELVLITGPAFSGDGDRTSFGTLDIFGSGGFTANSAGLTGFGLVKNPVAQVVALRCSTTDVDDQVGLAAWSGFTFLKIADLPAEA